MYRPEWFPKENVLQLALNLQMHKRGAAELSLEEIDLTIRALRYVLENWEDGRNNIGKSFDDCVFNLIDTTLSDPN